MSAEVPGHLCLCQGAVSCPVTDVSSQSAVCVCDYVFECCDEGVLGWGYQCFVSANVFSGFLDGQQVLFAFCINVFVSKASSMEIV